MTTPKPMMTFKVILEHKEQPGQFQFITVEECIDADDCINHIHETQPSWTIDKIERLL
jgi:hypothetical protein